MIERTNLEEFTQEQIDVAFNAAIKFFSAIPEIDVDRMQPQIAIAKRVIETYRSGTRNVIIEAPTGFGKSILALILTIVFQRLTEPDKQDRLQSYLLTSTKLLQEQYNRDLELFKIQNSHVLLKGQSNYICHKNGDNFTKRDCIDLSMSKVYNAPQYCNTCLPKCEYLTKRKAAIDSTTAVFNYAYWLSSMNFVFAKIDGNAPFVPRPLTIFDESHLLGDIVQGMFGTDINLDILQKRLETYSETMKLTFFDLPDLKYAFETYGFIRTKFIQAEIHDDQFDEIYKVLVEFHKIMSEFERFFLHACKKIEKRDRDVEGNFKPNDLDKPIFSLKDHLIDLCLQLEYLIGIYDEVGHDSIVLTCREEYNKVQKTNQVHLILQCTDESALVQRTVLPFLDYGLFMSATFGNIEQYAKQTGIEDYEAMYVDSDFDFSKSPIYMVRPIIRMNNREKDENMPRMLKQIENVLNRHPDECGLIHTCNYAFMERLKELENPRLKFYSNAEEKQRIIDEQKTEKNSVICGPSLLEGVDLKDDMSRFQIFMKVPYKSMIDKLTKRKMDKYPGWYDWVTMLQVLQGLGRSVRHKTDYATTYLLDGSFEWFLKKNKMPTYMHNRYSSTTLENIGRDFDAEFEALLGI